MVRYFTTIFLPFAITPNYKRRHWQDEWGVFQIFASIYKQCSLLRALRSLAKQSPANSLPQYAGDCFVPRNNEKACKISVDHQVKNGNLKCTRGECASQKLSLNFILYSYCLLKNSQASSYTSMSFG